jgi:hemerythrin-like domain-containing protein
MPVQIGAKAHSFSDPTGLLSDCHRRIEMFFGSLETVATVIDRPLRDTRAALESALRYFRESAPKHTADEEESLFPRLRQMLHPDVGSALTRLELLEEEHRQADPLHAEVDELGRQYLANGTLRPTEAERFRKAVACLASIYKQHIKIEDEVIFPVAARLLSAAEKMAIADEMATRRKVRLVTSISDLAERA